MKILVCIKQVPDTETKIQINSDGGLDTGGIKWVMNPYDEFAVEEALKLKEASGEGNVTVISLGPAGRTKDALRTALAMGADEAVAIDGPEDFDYYPTAKALASYIEKNQTGFNLILTGKLAIDTNNSSVPQALAEFLSLPHASGVSRLEVGDSAVVAEREVEGGQKEIFELSGPAVIGANKGLNTPRYASLPGIMKAKKKPLHEVALSDLGLSDADRKLKLSGLKPPPTKEAVKMIDGEPGAQASELARLLREEAKVI